MIEWLIGLAVFLLALVVMGIVADWCESDERRDAARRNQARPVRRG